MRVPHCTVSHCILPLLFLGACMAGPRERADPRPAQALFDGLTLEGWEGEPGFWRVENGVIVGESTPENPCEQTTYLVWRGGALGDFELELDWRFPADAVGANSGVQFRSQAPDTLAVVGYQADLESGTDWTGGLYEQGGRGVVTRRGERVVLDSRRGRTIERFADPEELLARIEPGQWNRLRVVAFGPRLSIEVNGELFSETIDLDPARAARAGSLALQLHAGPAMRVEYRAIHLRPLGDPRQVALEPRFERAVPEWIWSGDEAADGQTVWFRRRFQLSRPVASAQLWISADNHFEAWLDGETIARGDDWAQPLRIDLTEALQAGEHELVVRADNDGGPAGLVLELRAEFDDGRALILGSDDSFEASLQPADGIGAAEERERWLAELAPWSSARSLGRLGSAPWGELGEGSEPHGEALDAATIQVPSGFVVERLLSVPLATQGSWVSLAAAPGGVLWACDQYGGLFRITLSSEPDGAPRVEEVALALGEAHGLLWAFDSLYAVVSGAGRYASGLYRATDTDGDGELDEVRCLRTFEGDGEHGPHGIVVHPDGRSLVITGGNHTRLPEPFERSLVPTNWAEDCLLPPLPDPGGHAVGIEAPGGWVVRTDPEGKAWELLAVGLRNAYDLAYSSDGELFTFDADMEWDVGLPWYRPARILHVVGGADYGWRTGSSKWPADAYDSLPAVVDIGQASPTGLVFGTRTGFPAPWKQALFVCDWAYGRVFAVFLEPEGSSYRAHFELFASGEPFPVTDIVVGSDGALYLTTGGRRTQSGLYRITWAGASAEEREPIADAGAGARARRQALERLLAELSTDREFRGAGLGGGDIVPPASHGEVVGLADLGDPDPFIRHAARVALEHQDPALWSQAVLAESDYRRALGGLLALVRSDSAADARAVAERAAAIFGATPDARERLDALRLIELVLLRLEMDEELRGFLRSALDSAYPSGDVRLDRTLLSLLATLGADIGPRAMDALEQADVRVERLAILDALRARPEPSDDALLHAAFEREIAEGGGGASLRGYLERMRDEAFGRGGGSQFEEEAPVGAVDAIAPALAATPSVHAWTIEELESKLAAVESGRDHERGRAAYAAASCTRCHRLAGEGGNLGPDLNGAAGRYSAADLLRAIMAPSHEIPDVWRDLELWGEDQLLAVGRVESESDEAIVVLEPSGERVTIDPADVLERRPHGLSRMPEGLLDTLEADEILDMIAYILAGANPDDRRFR